MQAARRRPPLFYLYHCFNCINAGVGVRIGCGSGVAVGPVASRRRNGPKWVAGPRPAALRTGTSRAPAGQVRLILPLMSKPLRWYSTNVLPPCREHRAVENTRYKRHSKPTHRLTESSHRLTVRGRMLSPHKRRAEEVTN